MGYERSLCGQHILNKEKGGGEGGSREAAISDQSGRTTVYWPDRGDLLSVLTVDFYTFTLSNKIFF